MEVDSNQCAGHLLVGETGLFNTRQDTGLTRAGLRVLRFVKVCMHQCGKGLEWYRNFLRENQEVCRHH